MSITELTYIASNLKSFEQKLDREGITGLVRSIMIKEYVSALTDKNNSDYVAA